jgi:hypothetical protein
MQWVIQRMTQKQNPDMYREFEPGASSTIERQSGDPGAQAEPVQLD